MHDFDINKIKEILPHRYPFLLVDRVLTLEPGKSILALKNVSGNEEFFNGHFPTYPVMPGVLIIEALAQASGILGVMSKPEGEKDSETTRYFLAGIDNARFKRVVVPGDQLHLSVEIERARRDITKFNCTALVDNVVVATANIMTAKTDAG